MSEKQTHLTKKNPKKQTKVVPMLVKCPVIVPLIELQLRDQVCASKRGSSYMEVRVKNTNVWEINDSGSISLLVHSYHQKSVSFILYKRVIYTYTIIQHRNREQKASLGWRKGREEEVEG